MSGTEILRQAIVPALAGFVVCAAIVVYSVTHPVGRPPPPSPLTVRNLPRLLGYVGRLALGGYLTLLVIILVFSVLIVGDVGALRSAAWSGLFLLALSLPLWLLASWLEGRLRS